MTKLRWDFQTTIGAGTETVTVSMTYERDNYSIYYENVDQVLFQGVDVIGLFSEEEFNALETLACKKLREHYDEAKYSDFGLL